MKKLLLVFVFAGCSTIDYSTPPPADFPRLKVKVHEYEGGRATIACEAIYKKYDTPMPFGLVACSEYRFDTMSCTIHIPAGSDYWRTYEKAKCAGYNNMGDTSTVDAWEAWKKRG